LAIKQLILKDEKLNNQLSENGYVVMPFLNRDEVQKLLSAFHNHHKTPIQGFYATAHSAEITFRKKMSEYIKEALSRSVTEQFVNCNLLGGSFIVKSENQTEYLQPHQDWNIVDENKFRSFNIWIPLVDLHEANGTILVMPKSHLWLKNYRHSSIPCAFQNVHSLILQNMLPLYLKTGEALIYDHALLHASEPNRSDTLRIACACGIIPSEAEMKFYWNNSGIVEEYKSSPEFFLTENVFSGPHGLKKIKNVPYHFHQIDEIEFYMLSGIDKPHEEEKNNSVRHSNTASRFWEIYTPSNIAKEIKLRLSGK
jgi:hypothetical protein